MGQIAVVRGAARYSYSARDVQAVFGAVPDHNSVHRIDVFLKIELPNKTSLKMKLARGKLSTHQAIRFGRGTKTRTGAERASRANTVLESNTGNTA